MGTSVTMDKDNLETPKETDEKTDSTPSLKYFVIIPILMFYYTTIGLTFYVHSEWIQKKVETDMFGNTTKSPKLGCTATNHSDPSYIRYEQVQKKTSMYQLYNSLAGSIPGFVAAILLPSYTDSLGRRFFFVLTTSGFMVKMIISTITIYFDLSIWYIILGSFLDALTGAYYCFGTAATSYIADVTSKGKHRTLGLTLLSGIHLFSLLISSLVSGYFVKREGYLVPICTCTGSTFITLLMTMFVLPETLDDKNKIKRVSVLRTIYRTVEFYFSDTFKGSRGLYLILIAAFAFADLSTTHRSTLEVTYQLGMPFCWTAEKIGVFAAAKRATQGFAGFILIWPLQKLFSNVTIAIWSTVFITASYIVEAFAKTTWLLYLVPVVNTPEILPSPMLKAIMSSITPPDKQGSLFASLVTVEMVCATGASYVMQTVYAETVSLMNGFVFLVLAGICGIDLIFLIILAPFLKIKGKGQVSVNSDTDEAVKTQISVKPDENA